MIIPTLAFIAVNADESTPATVSFTSPAIPCNTGEKISLSDYSIQMTKDGEFTDNITWSSNDIEIKDGCVVVADKEGKTSTIEADSVILSVGYNPAPLATKGVHVIGDANKVGNLRSVIWGAWDVATKL